MDLIFCYGSNTEAGKAAEQANWLYGARYPSTIYETPIEFVDIDFKRAEDPEYLERYIGFVQKIEPKYAVLPDAFKIDDLDTCYTIAERLTDAVDTFIIVPKFSGCIERLPEKIGRSVVRIGYSVPTRYGGTDVPIWEFDNREVHLLGGSLKKQVALLDYLNVRSLDGNYCAKMANYGRYYDVAGRQIQMDKEDPVDYFGKIRLSLENIRQYFLKIEDATVADVQNCKQIADRHRTELGFVMLPVLKEAQAKGWLLVAKVGHTVIGFVNYRLRKDKNITIYEIVVDDSHRNSGIGRKLIETLKSKLHPDAYIRLKCPVGLPSNEFYACVGFEHTAIEPGKKRQLNVWKIRGVEDGNDS